MSNLTLLAKILRLKDLKITAFSFQQRDTELHLWVKPFKNGCRCPVCERRCPIVRVFPVSMQEMVFCPC